MLSNLALHTNYTYTQSKQKSGSNEGKSLNDLPRHILKTGLNYDFNKELNFWAQVDYIGKIKNGVNLSTNSYTLTDIGVNYKITKNASINFSVYNLFDKKLIDQKPVKAIVMDGRKFQLGFNVNF
ncbi:MAG: TonB-dependent receptor domain-containing protein [Campylobacter curvus]